LGRFSFNIGTPAVRPNFITFDGTVQVNASIESGIPEDGNYSKICPHRKRGILLFYKESREFSVMAEVPEIETLVRDLQEAVVSRTFSGVEVLQSAAVRFPEVPEFITMLEGRTVLESHRRAKYILLPLSGDLLLAMHMMLWGTLVLTPSSRPRAPETMIVYHLDRDEDLRLLDKLGYARAALGPPDVVEQGLDLQSLGPEALDPSFDVDELERRLNRRGVLKTVLLNQRVLAGLGNRDADESLWSARIDPRRSANTLTAEELNRLHIAIQMVLNEGVSLRGTQRDLFGRKGKAQHRRNIFERTGEPCPRCGTPISRTRIGGRNTHYCSNCQR
jgi:formamidopyrimidine-DNA glycosylase